MNNAVFGKTMVSINHALQYNTFSY
jgi:hypothetical protein